MSFLSDLADLPDEEVSAARIMEFYRGRAPEEIFGLQSKHDKERLTGAAFYKRSGMGPLPQVSLPSLCVAKITLSSSSSSLFA